MGNYFKTIYLYGSTIFKRGVRDPLTSIILIGIPVVLLVIFGLFLGGDQELNVRTAIINHSDEQLAHDFENTLRELEVLRIADEQWDVDQARQQMRDGQLDTIIELPDTFGQLNDQQLPGGEIIVHVNPADAQTSEIVTSIMKSIMDEFNRQLVGIEMPINITTQSVSVANVRAIHYIFPIFTGLGLMMAGALGVASSMPADKKSQVLRRLMVTPLRKSQVILGTGLAFSLLGIIVAIIMTLLSMVLFDLRLTTNDWITLAMFMLISIVSLVGFGLAIGGGVKNTTQGESIGQIFFLASMALSGVWFPVAMMPEVIQNIVAFMPLTPVIDGMRLILVESATLGDLIPQLQVIAVWTTIMYLLSFKIFRWE